MMEHEQIEANAVIERYVTGRLAEDEVIAFEEHLLDCASCIERVEAAERLQRGLGVVVAEEIARAGAVAAVARRRRGAWIAAVIVLLGAFGLWELQRSGETKRLEQELQLAQEELRRSAASSVEVGAVERRLRDAEAALAAASEARENLQQELESWKTPLANLPIALLTPLRGTDDAFEVELPREGRFTGLWIELGGEEYPTYRAELFDPEGERALTVDDLRFNDLGALFVQVPVELLRPGRWRLEVSGVTGGQARPLASFPLAVR